jgi:hypothetical protein
MAGDSSGSWITVYTGPVWRALSVQSLLDEAGFLTQVPDSNTRTMDPFITGGDAFSLDVLVPRREAQAALAVVASYGARPATAVRAEGDARLGTFARRMRWMTTMVFVAPTTLVLTAPIAFGMGLAYLVRARRSEARPAEHAFNLVTIAVAGLLLLGAILTIVAWQSQGG